jgi:hypothetical protein
MKELLALKQGDDTVYRYAQKFNSLCQYGEHHVDTDAKTMERFRDGLKSELYERLNLLEPNIYHELVNKAMDEDMNTDMCTTTAAAPDENMDIDTRTSTPATSSPASPEDTLLAPFSGPLTRARAHELNFVLLLTNEGPEA